MEIVIFIFIVGVVIVLAFGLHTEAMSKLGVSNRRVKKLENEKRNLLEHRRSLLKDLKKYRDKKNDIKKILGE
tara:strand:- start:405 stop:623 length:219 start_codon:yes stop_codon:yes gene_type:complete